MTDEQFKQLNPVIMMEIEKYDHLRDAYIAQGQFLKNHTFIFDTMDERQCEIIKLRCGLFDGKYWSLNKIANKFNLSTERVRQLEKKALLKLRHPYRIQLMKDYTDETFEKDTHEELVDDFKSLIRQDIVNNVVLQSFKHIENFKIQDLNIVTKSKILDKIILIC